MSAETLLRAPGNRAGSVESMGQDVLIVINDAPYGTEKAYNALRLAIALSRA